MNSINADIAIRARRITSDIMRHCSAYIVNAGVFFPKTRVNYMAVRNGQRSAASGGRWFALARGVACNTQHYTFRETN